MTLETTLKSRKKIYGAFIDNAVPAQRFKHVARECYGWSFLSEDKREAIDLILSKIARILSGDPEYADNWHDIQGYARLVEERMKNDR